MIGREARFTVRPNEADVAPLIGKLCRYIGPSGDLLAFGIFRGYMAAVPAPGEVWPSMGGGRNPWPFLMFDGFRVPTSGNYNAPETLQEVIAPAEET